VPRYVGAEEIAREPEGNPLQSGAYAAIVKVQFRMAGPVNAERESASLKKSFRKTT
jgi:hypothetical protein